MLQYHHLWGLISYHTVPVALPVQLCYLYKGVRSEVLPGKLEEEEAHASSSSSSSDSSDSSSDSSDSDSSEESDEEVDEDDE